MQQQKDEIQKHLTDAFASAGVPPIGGEFTLDIVAVGANAEADQELERALVKFLDVCGFEPVGYVTVSFQAGDSETSIGNPTSDVSEAKGA